MSEAPDLSTAIAAVRAKRDEHADVVKRLDGVLRVLAELHGGAAPFHGDSNHAAPEAPPESSTPLDKALAEAGTIKSAAKLVIEHSGRPMKAADIAKRIGRSPFPYQEDETTLRRSVASALARNCDEGDPFYKAKRGVYGVRDNQSPPNQGATAERPGQPAKGSIPEPVGNAEREEEASKTSLPLSGGSGE